ncbi:MAG: dUTP diphosphatase [Bacillota bacterium]|nr:dUTP diphosphatase [Bacillota bacterium]
MLNIKIKKLSEKAIPLKYQTEGSAGMDISACLDYPVTLKSFERTIIPTGFAMSIPLGYAGFIYARSGLAVKEGVTLPNCVGIIDSDYRGEVKVAVVNLSSLPVTINHGDRIAQLVITKTESVSFTETDELDNTERADGGFGSTGI